MVLAIYKQKLSMDLGYKNHILKEVLQQSVIKQSKKDQNGAYKRCKKFEHGFRLQKLQFRIKIVFIDKKIHYSKIQKITET